MIFDEDFIAKTTKPYRAGKFPVQCLFSDTFFGTNDISNIFLNSEHQSTFRYGVGDWIESATKLQTFQWTTGEQRVRSDHNQW